MEGQVSRSIEIMFKNKEHLNVLHAITTGDMWNKFLDSLTEQVSKLKFQNQHKLFISSYIFERVKLYVKDYLDEIVRRRSENKGDE